MLASRYDPAVEQNFLLNQHIRYLPEILAGIHVRHLLEGDRLAPLEKTWL